MISREFAALFSLFVPGLGQMLRGHLIRGFLWLIIVLIGYLCFVVPGLVLHLVCVIYAAKR